MGFFLRELGSILSEMIKVRIRWLKNPPDFYIYSSSSQKFLELCNDLEGLSMAKIQLSTQ